MWKAKASKALSENPEAVHDVANVEGLLIADYSRSTLGPKPNVFREFVKLLIAIALFVAVGFALAFTVSWYVGWSIVGASRRQSAECSAAFVRSAACARPCSQRAHALSPAFALALAARPLSHHDAVSAFLLDSFYFVWYTASTVGYGDYGLFECVAPTRFSPPYRGAFDVARVNASNVSPIAGTCRTPDSDSLSKAIVIVVVGVAVGSMTLVIVNLQKLLSASHDLVVYTARGVELQKAMRRAAFKVLQTHFDLLDSEHDGELEIDEISSFLQRQGLPKQQVVRLMSELDDDHSGSLSKAEIDAKVALLQRDRYRDLVVRFHAIDYDNSGNLEIDELSQLMPPGTSMRELLAMRDKLDTDGDGLISLEELSKLAEPDAKEEARAAREALRTKLAPYTKALLFLVVREAFVHCSAVAWIYIGTYREGNARVYPMGDAPVCANTTLAGAYTCLEAELSRSDHTIGDPWSYLDALYFVAMTMSTVGFGDFSPDTEFGRMFCVLWGMYTGRTCTSSSTAASGAGLLRGPPCVCMEMVLLRDSFVFSHPLLPLTSPRPTHSRSFIPSLPPSGNNPQELLQSQ